MSEPRIYRHPVTNRVKSSDRHLYMERAGFEPYDGEIEVDKVGIKTAQMSAAELRQLAGDQGLPTSGTKAELIERIAESAAKPAEETSAPSSDKGVTSSSSTSAGESK